MRDHDSPLAERFQAGKPIEALSTAEKIIRNITASHDPFLSRRRAANKLPAPFATPEVINRRPNPAGEVDQSVR